MSTHYSHLKDAVNRHSFRKQVINCLAHTHIHTFPSLALYVNVSAFYLYKIKLQHTTDTILSFAGCNNYICECRDKMPSISWFSEWNLYLIENEKAKREDEKKNGIPKWSQEYFHSMRIISIASLYLNWQAKIMDRK